MRFVGSAKKLRILGFDHNAQVWSLPQSSENVRIVGKII